MSIRKKLMAAYGLLVILPMALMVVIVSLMTAPIINQLESHIQLITSELKQASYLPVLKELQHAQANQPDILSDTAYLNTFFNTHEQLVTFEVSLNSLRLFLSDRSADIKDADKTVLKTETLHFNNGDNHYQIQLTYRSSYSIFAADEIRSLMEDRLRIGIATFTVLHLLFVLFLMKYFLTPFKELKAIAEKVRSKDYDFKIDTSRRDEIGDTFQAFDDMRHAIQTYENNRKELVANISHDLKTPLTAIKGYITAIQDGIAKDPKRIEKYLTIMQKNVTHLDLLVEDLLLYSKLDVDQVDFNFQNISLDKFMEYLIDDIRFETESDATQIQWRYDGTESLHVKMDTFKIRRVILNIVSNAIKHMNKDIKILDFSLEQHQQTAKLTIRDNGKGISPEDLPHVFDRFYRADSSRNTDIGGSGLGLAISKQILEKHGATVTIDSVLNQFTAVTITFPLEPMSSPRKEAIL